MEQRALTASSCCTPIDSGLDHHSVADHHRDVAVPHRGDTGQKPAGA